MALFYAYVLEPILPGKPLVKGLIDALIAWLLNALVVLPAIGEGIAGSRYLGLRHDRLCGYPHSVLRPSGGAPCAFPSHAPQHLGPFTFPTCPYSMPPVRRMDPSATG